MLEFRFYSYSFIIYYVVCTALMHPLIRKASTMMSISTGVGRSDYASSQLLSSGAIIGVALAGVFFCLIVIDLLLLCFRRQGVIATLCGKRVKKHNDDEAKLGR